ncbi:FlgD immunoglobulin-like domain containing protein [Nocardioides sp.]|uniref:FlgD immunoglobulin-like domain containing protein n=1 Tax=Nocardioides sp. TaxID=35761 RepID=UPI002BDA8345|nr:FlgD immunoglobulin-like domain containing protein [Nocardioides sp.]HSX66216.1 FlgD immunoglobulin-like domain containing protein [Nocardioides sp.]
MTRRVTTLLTTLGVTLGGLVVTAAPASAAYTGTIGPLDTSTPGHVRGTVTTDAPYVVVRVMAEDYWQIAASTQGAAAGTFDFDLETWGLDSGRVRVETCTSEGVGCAGLTEEQPFEASDVVPEVVWPADPFTGEDFTIAITDSGGGYLWAQTATGDGVVVPGDGTPTVLPAPVDGTQNVYLNRCANGISACNGLTQREVTIDRPISADAFLPDPWSTSPAVVNVDATPSVTAAVELRGTGVNPEASLGLAIHPTVLNASGAAVAGGTSKLYDLPLSDRTITFEVGLDHLKSGAYTLRIETAWGAEPTQRVTEEFHLEVTNPAPVINALTRSPSAVYPAADGYLDSTVLTLTPATWAEADSARFEIINGAGTVVRDLNPTTDNSWDGYKARWNGTSNSGTKVPSGTYTVKGYLTDRSGTTSEKATTVTVVRKHLANRTWTRTQTAAASYADWKYIGSCSTLRRPSLRGWSGSFGLYSNTRCTKGFNAGIAETHHGMYVAKPSNLRRYLDVRVSEYGGAAKSRPTSRQGLAYLSTSNEWRAATTLTSGLGTHHGLTRAASGFIHDRGTASPWVYWSAAVVDGRRYDVKSFTVRVRYEALVSD